MLPQVVFCVHAVKQGLELAKQLKQKPNDPNVLRNAFTAARDHVRDKYRNNPDCSLDWAYFIMLD